MHFEVIAFLDVHLAELERLRRDLTTARTIERGERRTLAAATVISAQQYAANVQLLLSEEVPRDPEATPPIGDFLPPSWPLDLQLSER